MFGYSLSCEEVARAAIRESGGNLAVVTAIGEKCALSASASPSDDAVRELVEFYARPELAHVTPGRRRYVKAKFRRTGFYEHTAEELLIGAKLAWRQNERCVGRGHWRTLELIDYRRARTAAEIAELCWAHLRFATNGGALKSVVTVGPWSPPGRPGFRIVNSQIIRYAGHRESDGTVLGDPSNATVTDLAKELGWKGAGTAFDILPLLVSTPDGDVQMFDVPADLVLEVPIRHPEHPWFDDMDLRWHAVPAIANMDLNIGGLTYSCVPFSGWYVNTEVGARNLSDTNRYDTLPTIAKHLNLDTKSDRTLWRDRALVELNRAVLHSFRESGAYMVDHHTVAKQFIDHVARESRAGRTCPTDWSWVNPPMSAGLTPTFHRYFDAPEPGARPSFAPRAEEQGCPFG